MNVEHWWSCLRLRVIDDESHMNVLRNKSDRKKMFTLHDADNVNSTYQNGNLSTRRNHQKRNKISSNVKSAALIPVKHSAENNDEHEQLADKMRRDV